MPTPPSIFVATPLREPASQDRATYASQERVARAARSPGALAAPDPAACGSPSSRLAPGWRQAFTLLELLVALFIAAILLGIVFYLFGQLQRGTRISLLRAQIALTASTVDARLRDDATGMLGPNRAPGSGANDPPAGCLVIVPALRQGFVPLPNGSMSRNKVRLRSDQLVFMSQRNPNAPHPWVSLIPKDGNLPPDVTSYEARLWYGALRDGNLTQGSDESFMAHHWMVGRDLKLVRKTATGTEPLDLTLDPLHDYTPALSAPSGNAGGLANVLAAATTWNPVSQRYNRIGWTNTDYLANLIGKDASSTPIPDSQTDYTNPPLTTPVLDLKRLQQSADAKNEPNGVQIADMQQAHMRLLDNCSEIVVQFAADLDKDGILDTYPIGHPLAGALIWYPEELHYTALKNTQTRPKLSGDLQTKFDLIKNNDWDKAFPAGFTPWVQTWPAGRFGDLPAGGWKDRFLFEYGETNNAPSQATAAPKVPDAYVFRFEDDQYRLVNHGFRQDGSIYANKFDGMAGIAQFPAPATSQRHWTPFPPTPAAAAINPTTTQLYTQTGTATAPAGPYPLNAATAAKAAGLNFGDTLGDSNLPAQATPPYIWPVADGVYRTVNPLPLVDPTSLTEPPRYPVVKVTQMGVATQVPAGTTTTNTSVPTWNDPASADSVIAAQSNPAAPADNPYLRVPGSFGPTNNHSAVYADLWRQWFKAVNDPAKQGTAVDWRNPQSDWPKLIRLRLRLHDAQGLIFSYSDEALLNGRDDDGDGVVDNPEEGRMAGVWYEYILAVPYPLDPVPHGHGD